MTYWVRQLKPTLKIGYLCIYALIIMLFYIYYYHISPTYGDVISYNIPEVDVAKNIKCALPYTGCEYDRLTGWSIGRFLLFAIVGAINPDNYSTLFVFSGIMEAMAGSTRGSPRMFTNLATNMLAYSIGSNTRQLVRPHPLRSNILN